MDRLLTLLVSLISVIIVGCGCGKSSIMSDSSSDFQNNTKKEVQPKPTENYLAELAEKKIRKDKPNFNPKAIFSTRIIQIHNLWEDMSSLAFEVNIEVNGVDHRWCKMIYYNDSVDYFGGLWLLTTAILNDRLYYTYETGFGVSIIHIGQVYIENGKLVKKTQSSFVSDSQSLDTSLGVKVVDNKIAVIHGIFTEDEYFSREHIIGWLITKENGEMVIVKDDGTEFRSKYIDKQQTHPKSE